ncbi:hypothetical protein NQ318_013659 [Aromia moschata]|uniref:Uncharacterized protein n=1 Tax=Aromia moschata TaxID=1265417 RepID=A0AAV8XYW8_9CUCU|nr:hypothetical protein NQ318_013659 [Aromia moschata]
MTECHDNSCRHACAPYVKLRKRANVRNSDFLGGAILDIPFPIAAPFAEDDTLFMPRVGIDGSDLF